MFDEADGIAILLDELARVLVERADAEILLVDDCSTDKTIDVIRAWRDSHPAIKTRVFRHLDNRGQSAAIATGVLKARGEWIATLDGDGQNDPADIPMLEKRAQNDNDNDRLIVCGHRTRRDDSASKRLASRVANTVRSWILKDHTPDTGCGLKLFPRALFVELPYFDHMHRFLPALVQQQGGRSISVPVNHRPRIHGRSKYGVFDRLWAGIVDVCGVVWLGRRRRQVIIQEVED